MNMTCRVALTVLLVAGVDAGLLAAQQTGVVALQQQVRSREEAFAKTMAVRDLAAFTAFLSPEAVFVGPNGVSRGPKEIAAAWKRYFDGPQAPFSWRPETVEREIRQSTSAWLANRSSRSPWQA